MTYATTKKIARAEIHTEPPASANGGIYTLLSCKDERTDNEIIDFAAHKFGSTWLMALWVVVIDGVSRDLANPHQNENGEWVWLLRKA